MKNLITKILNKKVCFNKNLGSSQRYTAFSLAEVLLTLGIIGVVAAMTIPTVVENNQKTQYVTALKKFYSNFNQVLVQYSADNGCVGDLKCTGLFDANYYTPEDVGKVLASYFNIAKQCGPGVSGCFPAFSWSFDGSSGKDDFLNSMESASLFITKDGMAFFINRQPGNCANDFSSGTAYGWPSVTGDMKQHCGSLYADVNGFKGPNNFGRDVFLFYITNGRGPKLYPAGGPDDGYLWPWNHKNGVVTIDPPADWDCNGLNVEGVTCAGRVIEEGWQMNY